MANMLPDHAGVCTKYVQEYQGTQQTWRRGLQTAAVKRILCRSRSKLRRGGGDLRNATEVPFRRDLNLRNMILVTEANLPHREFKLSVDGIIVKRYWRRFA